MPIIEYKYEEEKIIALHFAGRLCDELSGKIIEKGKVTNKEEATHLSRFFWKMITRSISDNSAGLPIPCEGSAEYWIEKLYNSLGGYLERAGFEEEWNTEIDNA